MVNYGEAIKKPFTDLTKLVIGIVLSIIPIINWFAQGFILESSGLGKTKPSKKMPDWKNWGSLFFKGFVSYVIAFIYAIPAVLVFIIGAGFTFISLMNTYLGTVIPKELLSSVVAGETSPKAIGELISQNWALALPTLISLAPILLLGATLLLLAVYLTPAAVLNYLKNNKFSKAFDLNLVFKKAFTVKYFAVWIIGGIIVIVVTGILNLIPVIGNAMGFFITGVIVYSLFGQAFREIKSKK